VERIDESGDFLVVAEFYSDDILGGNLLFSKKPYYPMTITTQLPSIILEIPKDLLFNLFCENPLFLRTYLGSVSDHASILSDKIKHYINKSIRESLVSYLRFEQKRQNTNKIALNISKKMLADKIGVQRTSLSRELKKMQNDGLILFDANHITIINLDPDA
jgi:CRP/FNR family transcriptional regulator, dissimilatory nitrate respiration regulator